MAGGNSPISKLKPGNFIEIDGEPCKVIRITLSKPGKHGSTKARIDAVGIFDNRKRNLLKPSSGDVPVPLIEKKNGQVVSISGSIAQIMDLEDYSMFEAAIPEEMQGKVEEGKEVLYWKIGERVIVKELK
jgi:translation initiation factor 5A